VEFTAGNPGLSAGALAGNTLVIGSINGVYGLNATPRGVIQPDLRMGYCDRAG